MELRIIKPSFKYVPGQWLFIQIPDVSHYQWHPVSFMPLLYLRSLNVFCSSLLRLPLMIRMSRFTFVNSVIGLVRSVNELVLGHL